MAVLKVKNNGEWSHVLIADGVGVASIEQTTTSAEDGGLNIITVTMTDGTVSTFTAQNGSKGSSGDSAYVVATNNGFEGTEEEWLESLKLGYTYGTTDMTAGSSALETGTLHLVYE